MKLATIQRIAQISDIPGADAIQVATVLGWMIVIKKGEYQLGDLCTYIQIDTIVPELPEYEFLRVRKFRVRTIKLRGQISQGLIVPLPKGKYAEGDDVTELLAIKKYEKPDNNPASFKSQKMPASGIARWIYLFKHKLLFKLFPFLNKPDRTPFPKELVGITDEERIQNMPTLLTSYAGKLFYINYKLDGSSITIIHQRRANKSIYRICSRKLELHDTQNDWYKVFTNTSFSKQILKLVTHFKTDNIIVQGEAIGKFNGNHHALKENEIRLFNIFVNGEKLHQAEYMNTVTLLDIPHCPLFATTLLKHDMNSILQLSEIKDSLNPKVEAEGLVWRLAEGNVSFKVINNKYLIKQEQ